MSFPLQLRGLIAATFTPMFSDGEIHLEQISTLVDFLITQGVNGLYVLGSTGEGVSLTEEERCTTADAFVRAAAGRIPVIVQVGCESLKQSRNLAAHAQEIGADGISAVSPVYFKPDSPRLLAESMAEIAAAAPRLPFYYYHIPAVTGVTVNILEFLRLGSELIPTLQGVKFTSPLVHEFQACCEFADRKYQILWGLDEMLLSGLTAGAQAAVGSTYNFAAPIYQRLIQAYREGDLVEAQRLQSQSQAIVRTFVPFGPRGAQKAIQGMVGPDCGPSRRPVQTLPLEMVLALRNDLEAIGFFRWITQSSTVQ